MAACHAKRWRYSASSSSSTSIVEVREQQKAHKFSGRHGSSDDLFGLLMLRVARWKSLSAGLRECLVLARRGKGERDPPFLGAKPAKSKSPTVRKSQHKYIVSMVRVGHGFSDEVSENYARKRHIFCWRWSIWNTSQGEVALALLRITTSHSRFSILCLHHLIISLTLRPSIWSPSLLHNLGSEKQEIIIYLDQIL